MATTTKLSLILLPLLLSLQALAQNAPAPEASGPANLTGILEKNGQFTTFIKLLASTQVGNQVENQLNSSTEGLTVFAPTDNAFSNLKAGSLNSLSTQQQVQLVLYHIIPKFYTLSNLVLVPNPVRTQATGNDGGVFGLNITGQNNQVNVSTGIVTVQVNNPLRQVAPLAVYQVDQVLLPEDLFGEKANAPKASPASPLTSKTAPSTKANSTVATEPTSAGNGASGRKVGVGFFVVLGLLCMGVF